MARGKFIIPLWALLFALQYALAQREVPDARRAVRRMSPAARADDSRRKLNGEITFSADDEAACFVNGELVASSKNWKDVTTINVQLSRGDVIAFRVTDRGSYFGLIAIVKFGRAVISTGGHPGWRAHKAYTRVSARLDLDWRYPAFSQICAWRPARLVYRSAKDVPDKYPRFPYARRGAQFVWAEGDSTGDSVFIRYRIGGEVPACPRRTSVWLSADGPASAYVNGRLIGQTSGGVLVHLRVVMSEGDVLAVTASRNGTENGVLVAVDGVVRSATGGDPDWRARRSGQIEKDGNNWMLPSYGGKICKWPSAVVRSGAGGPGDGSNESNEEIADEVGNAAYVWASQEDDSKKSSMGLRYRVGGDGCAYDSSIIYTAADSALLFVNGLKSDWIRDRDSYNSVDIRLRNGDVVGIQAIDFGGWFGVIASIVGDRNYSTGVHDWRAVKAFSIDGGDSDLWLTADYNERACKWPSAKIRPRAGKIFNGKAPTFPYNSTGAEYVWAENAAGGDTVFLRLVYGESC